MVQLALVDAAYSGDWSRIGAITKEQELFLQPIVNFIIIAHAILGVITAQQAQQRGLDTAASGVKVVPFQCHHQMALSSCTLHMLTRCTLLAAGVPVWVDGAVEGAATASQSGGQLHKGGSVTV
jgi:hypothetical protein